MVILDTDHLSLLEHSGSLDRHRLLRKLSAVAGQGIATTIVSFEEQIRGRLAYLASTRANASTDRGISSLEAATRQLCSIIVIDFDGRAATEFQRLKLQRLRVGTMDLKISAIVLAHERSLIIKKPG